MLNHSCDPNISKYFIGPNVVVVANRKIFKGEEVTENYFPMYEYIERSSRQKFLKKNYKFDCLCIPCNGKLWRHFILNLNKALILRSQCGNSNIFFANQILRDNDLCGSRNYRSKRASKILESLKSFISRRYLSGRKILKFSHCQ